MLIIVLAGSLYVIALARAVRGLYLSARRRYRHDHYSLRELDALVYRDRSRSDTKEAH